MWAQWTDNQSSYAPSNIRKSEMITNVFDNYDRKNKNAQWTETHHTNSILVQKCDSTEGLAKINLEPKYDFDQKRTPALQTQATKFA